MPSHPQETAEWGDVRPEIYHARTPASRQAPFLSLPGTPEMRVSQESWAACPDLLPSLSLGPAGQPVASATPALSQAPVIPAENRSPPLITIE